jgi:2-polyprenyl-3-methyl-5-hydroxy-6-metoxy-1,4-benzoquinol methylase
MQYYSNYNEDGRLFRDNAHRIEWLTTMKYFKELIPENSYILDGCAGTGHYAFELASLGHRVVASDIVPHNVNMIKEKQKSNRQLEEVFVGDICNISQYKQEVFDVVLCMGAFYHIDAEAQIKAFKECLRVLKKGGLLVISYINNMAVISKSIAEKLENMDEILNNYEARTLDNIFRYMTPNEMETMSAENNTKIVKHISTNGMFYLNTSKINEATEENFTKYMQLHFKTCEDKSLLGYSLHGLLFLQKQ